MWGSPFYGLQNKKLYLNTFTKQALRLQDLGLKFGYYCC